MHHPWVVKSGERVLRWKTLAIDLDHGRAHVAGVDLGLSFGEFALLHLLVARRHVALSKEVILSEIYGERERPDPVMIDVFVNRVRRKLAQAGFADPIATVSGRGYAFAEQDGGGSEPTSSLPPQGLRLAVA